MLKNCIFHEPVIPCDTLLRFTLDNVFQSFEKKLIFYHIPLFCPLGPKMSKGYWILKIILFCDKIFDEISCC